MGKELTILKQYISVNIDFDGKLFVIFEHTINCLSFGYAHLPQLEYRIIFLLFAYSSTAIYFETAKRTAFKV